MRDGEELALDWVEQNLQRYAVRWADERELQAGLEEILEACGFAREFHLDDERGVIDFRGIVSGVRVGVEVKVKGSRAAVLGQLVRYAGAPGIDALILATPSRRLLAYLPDTIGEVPVRGVLVGTGL